MVGYLERYVKSARMSDLKESICWEALSMNPYVDMFDIAANPQYPWSLSAFCANPNATIDDLIHAKSGGIEQFDGKRVDSCMFQMNLVPMDYVLKHVDTFDWNWALLSCNPSLRLWHVVRNMDKPWDWWMLCANAAVSFEDVMEHAEHLPWRMRGLSWNPTVNFERHILPHLDAVDWSWSGISRNPSVRLQHVLDHPELPWDWSSLTCGNPNIGVQDILQNPHLPWHLSDLGRNVNVTYSDVVNNTPCISWNWKELSINSRIFQVRVADQDYQNAARDHVAAVKIQRLWKRSISDPAFHLCKRRLHCEFNQLLNSVSP